MTCSFYVVGPFGTKRYDGFTTNPSGSVYKLNIQDSNFYCGENISLALSEVCRYAKEQFDWPPVVQVTILPIYSHNTKLLDSWFLPCEKKQ